MKKSIGAQTILYPHPVLIVGTYKEDGSANIAAVSWGGICCSRPPCVAVALRAATQTHGNIRRTKAFTVGIPSVDQWREADYSGTVSGRDEDKFAGAGLTAVKSELVDAPWVEEFPMSLECRLKETHEIGLHTQFIGEILDMKADEEVLGENGFPDIEKVRPVCYATGNRRYYGIGEGLGEAFTNRKLPSRG
ncbi:MAG: flavin reductase family protein [Planctomycetota bacterium]